MIEDYVHGLARKVPIILMYLPFLRAHGGGVFAMPARPVYSPE